MTLEPGLGPTGNPTKAAPLSILGTVALQLAILLAGLAAAAAIWGHRSGSPELIRLSRRAVYATAALTTLGPVKVPVG